MLVDCGVVRIRLRVCVSIVGIFVRGTWLVTCRPSGGSEPLYSLLLLKKVCCYLVEPGDPSLHIDVAQIVFGPSSFAAVGVGCARWGGVAVAERRRVVRVRAIVGGHLLVCA